MPSTGVPQGIASPDPVRHGCGGWRVQVGQPTARELMAGVAGSGQVPPPTRAGHWLTGIDRGWRTSSGHEISSGYEITGDGGGARCASMGGGGGTGQAAVAVQVSPFPRVDWVAVPGALRARRANRRSLSAAVAACRWTGRPCWTCTTSQLTPPPPTPRLVSGGLTDDSLRHTNLCDDIIREIEMSGNVRVSLSLCSVHVPKLILRAR
jgi:hypothetical protein